MVHTSSHLICFYLEKLLSYNKYSVWSKIQNIWPFINQIINSLKTLRHCSSQYLICVTCYLNWMFHHCNALVLWLGDLNYINRWLVWLIGFSLRDSGNTLVGVNNRLCKGGNWASRVIKVLNLFSCTGASTVYGLVYGATG